MQIGMADLENCETKKPRPPIHHQITENLNACFMAVKEIELFLDTLEANELQEPKDKEASEHAPYLAVIHSLPDRLTNLAGAIRSQRMRMAEMLL